MTGSPVWFSLFRWPPATGPINRNDAIVADDFAMLAADELGRPYSKAEHNRQLQLAIGHPRGSIEYKHQNISAVLKGLADVIEEVEPDRPG